MSGAGTLIAFWVLCALGAAVIWFVVYKILDPVRLWWNDRRYRHG